MTLSSFIDFNSKRAKQRDKEIHIKAYQKYYSKNRNWILEKKKIYNQNNKERIARYRQYYLDHKEELNLKHREWYRIKKNESKMSRT